MIRVNAEARLLLAVPVVFIVLASFIYQRLRPENAAARIGGEVPSLVPMDHRAEKGGNSGSAVAAVAAPASLTPADYAAAYTPRIAGLPHTAPVYDEVTKPVVAPYPVACIASAASAFVQAGGANSGFSARS